MKYKISLFFFLLLFLSEVLVAQAPKVLFIGNSYTEVNNLPNLIKSVANSVGESIEFSSNTPGGCTFQQHCNNQSMDLICQGGWDYVVLQEQSQYPSFPITQVQNEVFPFAARLNDSIEKYNPCAETIFYMTWGRENGDPQWAPISTYEGMDDSLYRRYMIMAEDNDALVAPVGRVWRHIRENYPQIQLYSGDGSHPSYIGSYAAACTFYTIIFENDPTQITFTGSAHPEQAEIIRNVVKQVVYDSLANWFVGAYNPNVDFTYTEDENHHYHFQNLSRYCEDYYWDFGDGNSSTEENPEYFYSNSGSYLVRLIGEKCGLSDTKEITIDATSSIQENAEMNFSIYPNPTNNILHINFRDKNIQRVTCKIYGLDGKLVQVSEWNQNSKSISIENLPQGVYQVVLLLDEQTTISERIIKR